MLVYNTHTSARTHRHTRISTHKHSDTHTHTLKLMCVSSCLHFHVCHRRRCPARCAVIRTSSSPGLALHRNTHTHTLCRTHSASYTDAHTPHAYLTSHQAQFCSINFSIVIFFAERSLCFFLPLLSSSSASSSASSAPRVCSFSFQKKKEKLSVHTKLLLPAQTAKVGKEGPSLFQFRIN